MIFILVLYLIAPTSTDALLRVVGGIFFLTLFLFAFLTAQTQVPGKIVGRALSLRTVVALLILQLVSVAYAINFYTGSSIFSVITGSLAGENLYLSYQNYFRDEGVAEFSIGKIPAILGLAATKSIFLFLFASVFLGNEPKGIRRVMMLSALPIVLMSMARGTFFEIFEILVVVAYGISLRTRRFKAKYVFYFLAVGISFFVLFILNTIRRYEDAESYFASSCATLNYCFSPYGFAFYVEYAIYLLSTYFSMGIFFLSNYISIIFSGNLLSSIFPLASTSFFGLMENGLERELCRRYLDCSAVWMPEVISWVSFFGLLIVFPAVWLFIRAANKFEIQALKTGSRYSFPILALLLIYLVSLPVGKFWTVSSQNILSTIFFGVAFVLSGKKLVARTKNRSIA
ncbi:hypothetical protein [Variovorax sp. PDC80]|uniref:hypothetical protein n=1 Tax=Variovorax sp. PDC80 TaxID=1882827 RepID=UPI001160B052|nr:hypothetical protein [Variovorax sp. PDC80]